MTTSKLTKSSLDTYDACPRKYQLRHELRIVPTRESEALRFGTAFHAGMEALGNGLLIGETCKGIDKLYANHPYAEYLLFECETVKRMVCGWAWRWADDGIVVLEAESVFKDVPIINPETGGAAQKHALAGRTDQVIKLLDGRKALREFKTTSTDISPGSDYWPHLNMNRQVNIYYMVQKEDAKHPVTAVLYDVARRPGIKPKKVAKKYAEDWPIYYGEKIDLDIMPESETPQMYGARVTANITEQPDRYFARREIGILESHLAETREDTWQAHLAIMESKRRGHWRRATRSCFMYGRCEYFNICSAGVDVTKGLPEGFRHEKPHSELEN